MDAVLERIREEQLVISVSIALPKQYRSYSFKPGGFHARLIPISLMRSRCIRFMGFLSALLNKRQTAPFYYTDG
jgi:hypothetical protein